MISKTLSHYWIIDKLGQGGMGEVFLAEDTILKRQVAVKVLPEAFSGDPATFPPDLGNDPGHSPSQSKLSSLSSPEPIAYCFWLLFFEPNCWLAEAVPWKMICVTSDDPLTISRS
jgi:serine/threonine protein kinase